MIAELEKLIVSGAGPTLGQEGYGVTYNMKEVSDEGKYLAKRILHYAEHVAAA